MRVCEEADFWARAKADPKVAFPALHGFMARNFRRHGVDLMDGEARRKLSASMAAAIDAGQAKNAEWMLAQYTRAPFLFGAACDERHRRLAAQCILHAAGHGARLTAAMAAAGVAAAAPVGAVQQRLHACFEREAASGELKAWWQRWGMEAAVAEWLTLATAPEQAYGNALLCTAQTPRAWVALRPLFVLMPHNTRLESYVSKHKQLEHHNTSVRDGRLNLPPPFPRC